MDTASETDTGTDTGTDLDTCIDSRNGSETDPRLKLLPIEPLRPHSFS